MAYPSPRALLAKHGLRAKKSWGQNFLGDEAALDQIARLAVEREGDRVVELGAGLGHLTSRLLARGGRVVAVERDRDMVRVLRGELGDAVEIVEADAARLDYAALAGPPAARIAVVGNLPYHLTSPILFSLLDQAKSISRAVLLVQREVAERLAARPGTKDWGQVSVLLQREADVSIERIVPPGAFVPPPRVESAVVRAAFRPPLEPVADPARLRRIVKAGFAQRRKTLANALRSARVVGPEPLADALARAGIDGGRRGETLTVAEWAALERALD
ncbi:MAG TPA: 16S rRNA (adenine(1518)-N(6)/adenine(1519)-N(6))-dimethyltransferase RsmA [Anaeromyxobacteraceae bacterium]|nr:16S rRNA (adenine(1518)-N(6)/adenine(1519)-N(6))-dimethyltransferase RsmA [Anaeromyxobacteraceae bacterium]